MPDYIMNGLGSYSLDSKQHSHQENYEASIWTIDSDRYLFNISEARIHVMAQSYLS